MSETKLDLFQYVLEKMFDNLVDNVSYYAGDYNFKKVEDCIDGLRHVRALIGADDSNATKLADLGYDDVEWIAIDLFNDELSADSEIFNDVNEDYNICSKEEVEQMVNELRELGEKVHE